jgi:exopolyphosphatase/guanosine-5'-triphosphate,3'-diphosphate pyrophosphatase
LGELRRGLTLWFYRSNNETRMIGRLVRRAPAAARVEAFVVVDVSYRPGAERGPGRNGRSEPVFAALDLGTNNCRLLVARQSGTSFRVIDAFSRIVRLGDRLAQTGELAMPAMDRTVEALQICAAKLRRRGVTAFRGVATEACRRARNGGAFVARIASETGMPLEIIEPREEAMLALIGCSPLLDPEVPYALLFDIGGGSTEITWLRRDAASPQGWELVDWISLDLGVVVLAERLGHDTITAEVYNSQVSETASRLAAFDKTHDIQAKLAVKEVQMLGTSGTVTTLSGISQNLPRYERALVDGSWLDLSTARGICASLRILDGAGRAANPCIGSERADLVLAGCAILEGILQLWPVPRLRVADRGLREGILLNLMRDAGAPSGAA